MFVTTKASGTLRILTGIVLLLGVIGAGHLGRSPWIIAPFAVAFTISFIIGRLARWKLAMRTRGASYLLIGVATTALTQIILVSLLYFIGLGLGSLLGGHEEIAPFVQSDWMWALGLGLVGALAGLVITRLEQQPAPSEDVPYPYSQNMGTNDFPIRLLEGQVTPENFYKKWDNPDGRIEIIEEQDITAAETRLGVKLPAKLRALYRAQDGGYINPIGILNAEAKPPYGDSDILTPFSEYKSLHACTKLHTVAEGFLSFASRDDVQYAHLFANGTDNMVLLAQWYVESLFLDYNQGSKPRVGFVDFDNENWVENVRWWPSFDAFFDELRFYEDVE